MYIYFSTICWLVVIALLVSVYANDPNQYFDHHHYGHGQHPESGPSTPDDQVFASLKTASPQVSQVAFDSLHPELPTQPTSTAAAVATATTPHCTISKHDSNKSNLDFSSRLLDYQGDEGSELLHRPHDTKEGFQFGHMDEDYQDAVHITTTTTTTEQSADSEHPQPPPPPLSSRLSSHSWNLEDESIEDIILKGLGKYAKAPDHIIQQADGEKTQMEDADHLPPKEPLVDDEKAGEPHIWIQPVVEKVKHAFKHMSDSWEDDWVDLTEDAGCSADEDEDKDGVNDDKDNGNGNIDNDEQVGKQTPHEMKGHSCGCDGSQDSLFSKLLNHIPGHHAHMDTKNHPIEDSVTESDYQHKGQTVMRESTTPQDKFDNHDSKQRKHCNCKSYKSRHLRAGWMAQELLLTFGTTIGELALIPATGGVFIVRVDGELVYDRKAEGRFPEMKELKQLVRNKIAPEMGLGHSDSAVKSKKTISVPPEEPLQAVTASASTSVTEPHLSSDTPDNEKSVNKECATCL
ncbi:hypothetical protein BGW41_004042 [Actinomortierella wolfii]|nr:hypothetical protein BGW41_004042 [Actinomortierella wolfii]